MLTNAAVVRAVNQLTIEQINLDPPKANEVLVRVRAAGVCHSDLHNMRGELRATPPLVLGHEGAGVVEEVGSNVTRIRPGDHIAVNWLPACGQCPTCRRGMPNLCERFAATTFSALMPDGTSRHTGLDGLPLKPMLSSATMSEYIVIDEAGVIPIADDIPFEVAAVAGCAVMTGVGAVINTAQIVPGSSAAVIGCGGVGLSAIMGCTLAGCAPVVAVDVMESKLEFARQFGATHTLNARSLDAVAAVKEMLNGGPTYVFDSVGGATTINQALTMARPGGTAVIIGMHSAKQEVPISAGALIFQNKRLLGCFAGSARPLVDVPQLLHLYRSNRLPIDRLVTARYALDQLPQAFQDMEAGAVARGVIVF
jgi:S-(hydroxymethyl)glutathione dehydrogenase/alcohol dehydrogenase